MNMKWRVKNAVFAFIASVPLFAAAGAPIQRIDVVNLLGVGATQTPVTLAFVNAGLNPCFTTTLNFQGAMTLWIGTNQACSTAVTDMTITPLPGFNGVDINYAAPMYPVAINGNLYSTQITISQKTEPVYDPGNGELLIPGTIQTAVQNHWTND